VSRPSVRSGLRSLAAIGVVQTRHGSGTYITDGPPALDSAPLGMLAALHGFSPEQMFEARRVLETGVAGLAAERATPEQVAAMADEVAGMFASLDDPRSSSCTMCGSTGPWRAGAATRSWPPSWRWCRASTSNSGAVTVRTPEQLRDVAVIHRNIYHAVRARDAERARREMSQHLPRSGRPVGPADAGHRPARADAPGGRRLCTPRVSLRDHTVACRPVS
jgi:GntR family transcriptional regulator, transcriptional repressor for pyruvate dehydrogenase complex